MSAPEKAGRAVTLVTVTVDRRPGSWCDRYGTSVSASAHPPEHGFLGVSVTVRFHRTLRQPVSRGNTSNLGRRLARALDVFLGENGARSGADDRCERQVAHMDPTTYRSGKSYVDAEIVLGILVKDPRWAALSTRRLVKLDPWDALDVAALESFLRDTAARLAAEFLKDCHAALDASRARAEAAQIAERACESVEAAGHFEARIAALREEQNAARHKEFRRMAAAVRGGLAATEDANPILHAATDPGVRVVFCVGAEFLVRVSLATDTNTYEEFAPSATTPAEPPRSAPEA